MGIFPAGLFVSCWNESLSCTCVPDLQRLERSPEISLLTHPCDPVNNCSASVSPLQTTLPSAYSDVPGWLFPQPLLHRCDFLLLRMTFSFSGGGSKLQRLAALWWFPFDLFIPFSISLRRPGSLAPSACQATPPSFYFTSLWSLYSGSPISAGGLAWIPFNGFLLLCCLPLWVCRNHGEMEGESRWWKQHTFWCW